MPQRPVLVAAKGGAIVFVGRLFAWGSRLVLAVLLARLLGAEQYGLYNLALTVATVAASFPSLGLDSALVRYLAVFAQRDDAPGVRGSLQIALVIPAVLSLVFAGGVVLLADLIARGPMNEPRLVPLLFIASLMVPATVLSRQFAAALQGLGRIHQAVFVEQFSQPTIRFVMIVALAFVGLRADLAVAASAAAALLATLLLAVFVRRALSQQRSELPARRETGEILRFSMPVFFSNVVHAVGSNLQTLLLGALSTIASVGIFAVASQVNLVGSIFHSAVVAASMPLFAALQDRGDRGGLERLYRTTSKWSLTLNLPLFLVVVAFPDALLAAFGEEFEAGALALVILAWANLVNAATGTSGAVLDMTGHTRVKLLNSSLSVALALGLNLVLIPPFGLVGAAIAALAATSSVNLLRLAEVWFFVRIVPYDRSYAKPALAGALALGSALFIGWLLAPVGTAAQAIGGIVVLFAAYCLTLVRLGLSDEDRMVLGRIGDRLLRRRKGGRGRAEAIEAAAAEHLSAKQRG